MVVYFLAAEIGKDAVGIVPVYRDQSVHLIH